MKIEFGEASSLFRSSSKQNLYRPLDIDHVSVLCADAIQITLNYSATGTDTTYETLATSVVRLQSHWPEQSIYPRIVTANLADVMNEKIIFFPFNKLKAKVVGCFSVIFLPPLAAFRVPCD